jgi:hypothetical protein
MIGGGVSDMSPNAIEDPLYVMGSNEHSGLPNPHDMAKDNGTMHTMVMLQDHIDGMGLHR